MKEARIGTVAHLGDEGLHRLQSLCPVTGFEKTVDRRIIEPGDIALADVGERLKSEPDRTTVPR